MQHSPGHNDEKIEPVPGLREERVLAPEAHADDLDGHLDREEGEDEVVEALEDVAAQRGAHLVVTRLVHAEGDAVEHDDAHADPLKPCAHRQGRQHDRGQDRTG